MRALPSQPVAIIDPAWSNLVQLSLNSLGFPDFGQDDRLKFLALGILVCRHDENVILIDDLLGKLGNLESIETNWYLNTLCAWIWTSRDSELCVWIVLQCLVSV